MNKLFLVSGHSGSGKTTVMRKIMSNEIISFTTREPRVGEIEGVDYKFITVEQYEYLFKNNLLAEYSKYGGNYYGLTMSDITSKLNIDHSFSIVDVHGMKQLKEIYPESVSIFIYTSKEQAVQQMINRGDNSDVILKRMETYEIEMQNKHLYDYAIRNNANKLEKTVNIIKMIIESETEV